MAYIACLMVLIQSPILAFQVQENGPQLAAPELILDGDQPINVDQGHAAPAVYDIDGDGKKDLLVGQFSAGKLRVYLNRGTNREPKFQGWSFLSVEGRDVSVPWG